MFYIKNLQDSTLMLLSVFSSDFAFLNIMTWSVMENSGCIFDYHYTDNREVTNYMADVHNVLHNCGGSCLHSAACSLLKELFCNFWLVQYKKRQDG